MSAFTITPVTTSDDIKAARNLFSDYANWLENDHGISLEFQGINEELASLPGKYAPPKGQIYLALDGNGKAIACGAFRPFKERTCEIKRLYVSPDARGHRLGTTLVEIILKGAKEAGYSKAVLDTASFMTQAQSLYEGFGFKDIPKYYENPMAGVRYMGADL